MEGGNAQPPCCPKALILPPQGQQCCPAWCQELWMLHIHTAFTLLLLFPVFRTVLGEVPSAWRTRVLLPTQTSGSCRALQKGLSEVSEAKDGAVTLFCNTRCNFFLHKML